jgi:hypothetical protein
MAVTRTKTASIPIWAIGACVAFAIAGGAGYFMTTGVLEQAREDVKKRTQKMSDLSGQSYLPTSQNMEILDGNIAALHQVIDPVLAHHFLPSVQRMAYAAQGRPEEWKESVLDSAVQKLIERAKSRGVSVRPDFTFGFGRYTRQGPVPSVLPVVANQLYGVDHALGLLFDVGQEGGVNRLDAVRRTFDDDGPPSVAEMLAGHSQVDRPYYNRYPLEIDFSGTTAGLRNFLNALVKSPDLYIVRSVQVNNSRPDSPHLPSGNANKGADIAFGNDTIQARVWLDLIEWTGVPSKVAATTVVAPDESEN